MGCMGIGSPRAAGIAPFTAAMGPGENVRWCRRGDGGSGDQAKPMGAGAAPIGEAVRETAVPWRGAKIVGACDQLKPLVRMAPAGLAVRMAACGSGDPCTTGCRCTGDGDLFTYTAPVRVGLTPVRPAALPTCGFMTIVPPSTRVAGTMFGPVCDGTGETARLAVRVPAVVGASEVTSPPSLPMRLLPVSGRKAHARLRPASSLSL
mmetsp:Transcript_47511/g.122762  ORF Transcript_47511/g.122762 Transcript_47511/m.122762 type:complete len:206 (+) Transcript_47511:139-756(+)